MRLSNKRTINGRNYQKPPSISGMTEEVTRKGRITIIEIALLLSMLIK